ncbi:MAG: ATP-dependent zinc metalloprotease FtsH [Mycobacteriales bacterium]
MAMLGSARRRREQDGDGQKPSAEEDPQRNNRKRALVLCLLALPLLIAFYALILYWSNPRTAGEELRIDEFTALLRQGRIAETKILETDNRMIGTYDGGEFWVAYSGENETIFARLTSALEDAGVPYSVKQQPLKNLVMPVSMLLPALIIIDGLFILFLAFGRGGDGFTAFGQSRGKRLEGGDAKITFSDVAGVDEAIEELVEVRDYLSNPDRFLAMGASVPKGILLTGPPGCGKTLLARGLAGESEVPFFSISGSDFVEIFVGVGAARIRDFFKVAKAAAPCIVFIDELDAVGRGRSTHSMGGTDEREATLNQLLVEMDGFESGIGVVVLAATNRPDILDSALMRPGRFDRRVAVERPDVNGREGVLRIHTRGKPLADGVDIAQIAKRTAGFSGADLANVVNEAALLAARRGAAIIEQSHFSEAIERLVAGPERKSRILSPQDRLRIAYHEAGHAVVATALPGTDRVGKLSIVARGHGGGFTWWINDGDQTSITRAQLLDRITALLGGRAAEEIITGDLSTGAAGDLDSAVLLARRMVTEFGMGSSLGAFSAHALQNANMKEGLLNQAFSERVASEIDAEIQQVLADAAERARNVLLAQRSALEAVGKALMEHETLEGELLDALLLPVHSANSGSATLVP